MFGITDSGQKNLGNGLIMHLDAAQKISYGGTGTVWTDLSGNNRSGSLENGPTFDSSNGGGFLFDGTNDRWKAIIGNIGTGSFTLEYVFKFINNSIYLDALCHAGVSQDGADSMGFGFATDGGNNFNFTITSRSVQLQADVLYIILQEQDNMLVQQKELQHIEMVFIKIVQQVLLVFK